MILLYIVLGYLSGVIAAFVLFRILIYLENKTWEPELNIEHADEILEMLYHCKFSWGSVFVLLFIYLKYKIRGE